MKKITKVFLSLVILGTLLSSTPSRVSAQSSFSFQLFYDDLSPYGEWVDNPDYGYVWIPDVSEGFAPYGNNGYWVFTDAGWTWLSYYEWGWAPFHYGRWYFDPYYGYAWIPGDEWGPGWVTWRRSAGYYGWAPIGPGISIDIAYSSGYRQPYNQWRFVRDRDFGNTNIYNYYISTSNYTTIINNSFVINNIYEERASNVRYNTGPGRDEVQRHTGTSFKTVSLHQRDKPGQALENDGLKIYRPRIENKNDNVRRPAPARTTSWNNGKPETKNNTESRKRNGDQPSVRKPSEVTDNGQSVKPPRTDQPVRQETRPVPAKPKNNEQAVRPPRTEQPVKQETRPVPAKPKYNEQPVRPPRTDQPVKQETRPAPAKPKYNEQPVRPPRTDQPVKQETRPVPAKPKYNEQPVRPPRTEQPARQENKPAPVKPKNNEQPVKPSRTEQPVRQETKPAPGKKQRDEQPAAQSVQPLRKEEPMQQPKPPKQNDQPVQLEPEIREANARPGTQWPVQPLPRPSFLLSKGARIAPPVQLSPYRYNPEPAMKKRKMAGLL